MVGLAIMRLRGSVLGDSVTDKDLLIRIVLALHDMDPNLVWSEMVFDYRSMLPRIGGKWYYGNPPRRVSRLCGYCKDAELDLLGLIEVKFQEYNSGIGEDGELAREPKSVKMLINRLTDFGEELGAMYGEIKWRKGFDHLMSRTNSMDSKMAHAFGRFFMDTGVNLDYRSLLEEIGPKKLKRSEVADKYKFRVH